VVGVVEDKDEGEWWCRGQVGPGGRVKREAGVPLFVVCCRVTHGKVFLFAMCFINVHENFFCRAPAHDKLFFKNYT
jgi:hypothetical protein